MPRTFSRFDWAEFVHTLRTEEYLDCSQEQLARLLKVSVSSISKWESGTVTPQPRHRRALWRMARRARYRREDWPRYWVTWEL